MSKIVNTVHPVKRALSYAARGWRVVPMYSASEGKCSCYQGAECKKPGKHPITPHGVKGATTNRKTIKKWWSAHPKANIGIATGKQSEILALDIDPRNGGDLTLKTLEAELGTLPDTVMSNTGGGGKHLLFAYPKTRIRKDSAGKLLGIGVDVLSEGAIMVAPPSRHAAGVRYKWAVGQSLKDCEPADLPKKWLDKLTQVSNVQVLQSEAEVILEGERNSALTSLAGTMRRAGASTDAILAALTSQNKIKCTPPPFAVLRLRRLSKASLATPLRTGRTTPRNSCIWF